MENRVAVVTGSTSGIGLGIAHHLADKGCHIILTGLGEQTTIDNLMLVDVSVLSQKNNNK